MKYYAKAKLHTSAQAVALEARNLPVNLDLIWCEDLRSHLWAKGTII